MSDRNLYRVVRLSWAGMALACCVVVALSPEARAQLAPAAGAYRAPAAPARAEGPEPPLATDEEPLTPAEERLFGKLRRRIIRQVDERLVDAVDEAANKKGVGGSVLAAALMRLVKAVVNALIVAVVTAVLIDLVWKYGLVLALLWILAVAVIAAPAGWLAGRRGGASRAS